MPRTFTEDCILRPGSDAFPAPRALGRPGEGRVASVAGRGPSARRCVHPRAIPHEPAAARAETCQVFTETRRLRDELRTTHARIASLEAERADYLRKDRRAGVLTHDAFRE